MTDLVDQMFPPIHRKWTPEFTDFNYWRAPVQDYPLPDLSPPSPALSARSDTTLSRLRNFSLVSSRQPTRENSSIGNEDGPYRSSTLRQMSSFEKLSSTLGFSSTGNNNDPSPQRSASPDPFTSDDEGSENLSESGRKRERRRSVTSMPGSLHEDDMTFDEEDEEEGVYDENEHHEGEEEGDGLQPEEHAEDAFDDDLLAAGEMQKVPFL
jgi:phosphatidate phosphatase LPIN